MTPLGRRRLRLRGGRHTGFGVPPGGASKKRPCGMGRGGISQLFLMNWFLQWGQVMRILPLPRGTRTVARHWGHLK